MKTRNFLLRKVLVAVLVLAMLASVIATAVTATGTYGGKLSEAQSRLDKALAAATAADMSAALADVYAYVTDEATRLDPNQTGYSEFVTSYNALTLKCGVMLYDVVKAAADDSAKSTALAALYVHFAGAGMLDGLKPTATFDDRYVCSLCGQVYTLAAGEKWADITDAFICADTNCAGGKSDYAPQTVSYTEFIAEYESVNLGLTESFIEALYSAIQIDNDGNITSIGYYDYVVLQNALRSYLDNVLELDYKAPVNVAYTGTVSAADALLSFVRDSLDLESYKTALANVYNYLVSTPVDPTSDAYYTFYQNYLGACDTLGDKICAAVDAVSDVDDKIAVLNSAKAYLAATPVSAYVFDVFNDKVAELKEEYGKATESLSNPELVIDPSIYTPTAYVETVDAWKALVDAIVTTDDLSDTEAVSAFKTSVKAAFDYITATPVDPEAVGYAEALADYTAKRDALAALLAESVAVTVSPADKYAALAANRDYLAAAPISKAAIDAHNSAVAALSAELEGVITLLGASDMTITAPTATAPTPNARYEMLGAKLSEFEAAASLDGKKAAMTELYRLVTMSVLDTADSRYASFVSAYNAAATELTEALLATIVDATAAPIAAVNEYLAATPYTKAAVVAYNARLDELIASNPDSAVAIASKKLSCVLLDIDAYAASITSGTDIDELMATVDELYKYALRAKYNIADADYAESMTAASSALTAFEGKLMDYIDSKLDSGDKYNALVKARDFILATPITSTLFTKYNDKLASALSSYTSVKTNTDASNMKLESVVGTLTDLLADVTSAEALDDKKEAFKTLYNAMQAVSLDPTDSAEFNAAYGAACAALIEELVASVDVPTPAGIVEQLGKMAAFVKAAPFSAELVTAYIETYNEVKGASYDASLEAVNAAFATDIVYTPNSAFNSDFTDAGALADALDETTANIVAMYEYLAENKLDVASKEYAVILNKYNDAKDAVLATLIAAIDNVGAEAATALKAGTLDSKIADHIEAFDSMRSFLTEYCFSARMVEAYNDKRISVANTDKSYADLHKTARLLYSEKVAALHAHTDACPVTEAGVGKEAYDKIVSTLDAFEYAELAGLVAAYETETQGTSTPVNSASSMFSKINSYFKKYPITGHNGYETFLQLYNNACEALISDLCAEIDTMKETSEKLAALKAIEDYLEVSPHSAEVVKMYNDKLDALIKEYGDVVDALADEDALSEDQLIQAPAYKAGAVAELNALLAAYNSKTTIEDKKTAFAEIYAYITSNNIDKNEAGYADFEAAYGAVRAALAEELFAAVDAASTAYDKLEAYKPVRDYLNTTPIEQAAVDAYNDSLAAFVAEYTEIRASISGASFTFKKITVPPNKLYQPGTISAFGAAVNTVDSLTQDTANMDGDAVIDAIKAVHDLLRNNMTVPDPSDPQYSTVMTKYEAALTRFSTALKTKYEAATRFDDRIAILTEIKEYLTKCVYSQDMANAYSAYTETLCFDLDDFIAEASADEMTVVSPFGRLDALMKAIDSTLSLNKLKRAFAEFYAYYKSIILDVTDPYYSTFIASFDENAKVVTDQLYKDYSAAKTAEQKYDALMAAKSYIIANPINAEMIADYNIKLEDIKSLGYAKTKATLEADYSKISFYTGSVSELNTILDGLTGAADNAAKMDIIKNAFDYITSNNLDTAADGYDAAYSRYTSALNSLIAALISDANGKSDPAEKQAAIDAVRAYIEESYFSEAVVATFNVSFPEEEPIEYFNTTVDAAISALGKIVSADADKKAILAEIYELVKTARISSEEWTAASINAAVTVMKAEVSELIENAKIELDKQTSLSDYDTTTTTYDYDFNDGKMPWTYNHTDKNPNAKGFVTNGYMSFVHGGPPTSNTSSFIDTKMPDTSNGLVFEFDLTTHNHDMIKYLSFAFVEDGLVTGARIATNMFRIVNNNIMDATGNNLLLADAFTPGEWTHMILVYHADTFSLDIYANYELIGSYALKTGTGEAVKYTTTRISIDFLNCSASFDNFLAYSGTSFRILDKFEKMSVTERFNYYVDFFADENNDSSNRNRAYQAAKSLLSKVESEPACAENYAFFLGYDYEKEILGAAREHNDKLLLEKYNAIGTITTTNTASKIALVDSIQAFIEENIQFIDQSSEVYKSVVEGLKDMRNLVVHLENTKNLVDALSRFKRATTLASMTRHMASATSYFEACEFNIPENYELVKDDETVTAFLASVDPTNTMTLVDYYNSMPDVVAAELKRDNAKRIIDCIALIEGIPGYDPEATGDDKEAFWVENYDAIDKYLSIIRGVINNYDPAYEGVAEAVAVYEDINTYFFDILQIKHIEIITEQLLKYTQTESYIEKRGICAYIDKYKEENDIDYTLAELNNLFAIHEVYKAEVESYKEQYQTLLDQNTIAFIATVEQMDATPDDYALLKALFDKATSEYYYNMNVDSEDAELKAALDAAIVRFEAYGAKITDIELATEKFLAAAKTLKNAKTRKQIYTALVGCAAQIDLANIDAGEGVEAAIELYNTTLAEYNAQASSANGLVSDANELVSSVRSMSIPQAVLAIIKNIFSK